MLPGECKKSVDTGTQGSLRALLRETGERPSGSQPYLSEGYSWPLLRGRTYRVERVDVDEPGRLWRAQDSDATALIWQM